MTDSSTNSSTDSGSVPTFADLVPDERVLAALTAVGYEEPTPIQARTIPAMLDGRDVVGLAQTGTGKTAAFAVPILCRVEIDRRVPQALVLTPTRELALQVAEAFTSYATNLPGLTVLPLYGGAGYGAQLAGLRRGAQVVVGTPGRVIDHLERGTLDLSGIDTVVLDEADEMLRVGFAEAVDTILATTPEYKQSALFSATLPAQVKAIAKRHLHDPVDVAVRSQSKTVDTIAQSWMMVPHHAKLDALTRILEVTDGDAMIIFVRTKQATEELAERLRARGFAAQAINGDLVQAQRERTIAQLRDGSLDILVATDVAARGLDVDRISHVVNHDLPHDVDSYVHRIGRTGRAGRTGAAISFATPRERRLLSAIERHTGTPIARTDVPTVADVNARRRAKFGEEVSAALESDSLPVFRELITDYLAGRSDAADPHGTGDPDDAGSVDPVDLAAAFAVMAHPDDDFWLVADEIAPASERSENRAGRRSDGDRPRTAYRLAVGRRDGVQPGMVVGALCNEAGLHRSDFGKITIGAAHSIVELPADLPAAAVRRAGRIKIAGRPIGIELDRRGRPGGRPARHADHADDRRSESPRTTKPKTTKPKTTKPKTTKPKTKTKPRTKKPRSS